jgi:hypothetical protein
MPITTRPMPACKEYTPTPLREWGAIFQWEHHPGRGWTNNYGQGRHIECKACGNWCSTQVQHNKHWTNPTRMEHCAQHRIGVQAENEEHNRDETCTFQLQHPSTHHPQLPWSSSNSISQLRLGSGRTLHHQNWLSTSTIPNSTKSKQESGSGQWWNM